MAKPRHRYSCMGLEQLEPRTLLSVNVLSPFDSVITATTVPTRVVDLVDHFDDPDVVGSVARFDTVLGEFFIELFDVSQGTRTAAPNSVAHFLNHVNGNLLPNSTTERFSDFQNTIVHRVDTNLGVIQGGGFAFPGFDPITPGPTLNNEFSATRPNTRGTIAFAKQGGNPNSATSQWFINTDDNTTTLGPQNNGGFTVFGEVIGDGMTVVDAIAAVPVFNATSIQSAFGTLPLRNVTGTDLPDPIEADNVTLINDIEQVNELTFTAASSNPDLVTATIDNGILTLELVDGQEGSAMITVTATDVEGNTQEQSFMYRSVSPTAPPTVAKLRSALRIKRGTDLRLTAVRVDAASPADPMRVEFFRDTNGDGMLDVDVDELLGMDEDASRGWRLNAPTDDFETGQQMIFTRVVDSLGQTSAVTTRQVQVINNPPRLKRVITQTGAQRDQDFTFTYNTLIQAADEDDPNGDPLQIVIDEVREGTLMVDGAAVEPGVTTLLPGDSVVWTPPAGAVGRHRTFAFRVSDGEVLSARAPSVHLIINHPPDLRALQVVGRDLEQPGASLTLRAGGGDRDGDITQVRFFRDSDDDGVLDVTSDQLLGTDTSREGGWQITTSNTTAFPTGQVRYFAVATDDTMRVGDPITILSTVNTPPAVGDLTADVTQVTRPGNVTLTLDGVADPTGRIRLVEFFADIDGSGTVTDADVLLGRERRPSSANTYQITTSTDDVPAGMTTFIARATDDDRGTTSATLVFDVMPTAGNAAPTLDALTTRESVGNLNQPITFQVKGADDDARQIVSAVFFRDDGDGTFDATADTVIGRDFSRRRGWSLTHNIPATQAVGLTTYFVQLTDIDGAVSEPASIEIMINPRPSIGALTGPTVHDSSLRLTLNLANVTDTAPGTIDRVELYHDANGNGIIDALDLRFRNMQRVGTTHRATISTGAVPQGNNVFLARAIDNDGGVSNTAMVSVLLF